MNEPILSSEFERFRSVKIWLKSDCVVKSIENSQYEAIKVDHISKNKTKIDKIRQRKAPTTNNIRTKWLLSIHKFFRFCLNVTNIKKQMIILVTPMIPRILY